MDDEGAENLPGPDHAPRNPIVDASPSSWSAEAPADDSAPPLGWTPAAPPPRPGATVEVGEGLVLAGIGTRLSAFLIDLFVLSAASIAITGASDGLTSDRGVSSVTAGVLSAVIGIGYFAAFWVGPWAATPGQRLAGLRVLDAGGLDRIESGRAILRSLLLGAGLNLVSFAAPVNRLLDALLIVWPIVLIGSVLFDARRQGFHDRWTRTIVVRRVEAGSLPLTIGCLMIALIVLVAPFVVAAAAGPAIQQLIDQVPGAVPSP